MKKYQKLWKFLFNKYANSGYSVKDISSFDKIKMKSKTINVGEILKFLNDHRLGSKVIDK